MICACSSIQIERVKPPAVLLEPCPVEVFAGETYGDLILHTVALRESLRLCNNDKAALKKWAAE
jgi:hypothetical protein